MMAERAQEGLRRLRLSTAKYVLVFLEREPEDHSLSYFYYYTPYPFKKQKNKKTRLNQKASHQLTLGM